MVETTLVLHGVVPFDMNVVLEAVVPVDESDESTDVCENDLIDDDDE